MFRRSSKRIKHAPFRVNIRPMMATSLNMHGRILALAILASGMAACSSTATLSPGQAFRDCAACPAMMVIPAGSFRMGSPESETDRGDDEGPAHTVVFAAPFAMGRYEVTRGEFARFVAETGYLTSQRCLVFSGSGLQAIQGKSWLDPGYHQTDQHPAVCVSWRDAAAYAAWLATRTGMAYRLPSEAEWEYAARGGSSDAYAFAGTADDACSWGNVADLRARAAVPQWNTVNCDDGVGLGTAPAGSYRPNGFGLYDTVGNVWEWTADCYQDNYADAPADGSARGSAGQCGNALDRGGGFSNVFAGHLRAANRSRAPSPDIAVYSLGFRVARDFMETDDLDPE
jgi:formylglycine-generating enzyme required for sulfatase activity